jgi:hypothetical protein
MIYLSYFQAMAKKCLLKFAYMYMNVDALNKQTFDTKTVVPENERTNHLWND